MRPIVLNGHERPITKVFYNRDGDLIFTAAKNPLVNVWYAANGERLGTYSGHDGVVWWLDVDWSTTHMLTASGDYHSKLWDVETGKELGDYESSAPMRSCGISYCGNLLLMTTDDVLSDAKQKKPEIIVIDKRDPSHFLRQSHVLHTNSADKTKVTGSLWGPSDRTIICGHDSGSLSVLDVRNVQVIHQSQPHKGPITDLQMHLHMPMFISASKDHTAKLFSAYDLSSIRTYTAERPINSAALSPVRDHVLVGGGQEAHEVTTTSVAQGKFDARLYHMIYQDELGRVKGHFGPINSVSFTSDGTGFATGGEEGYVRLHTFDADYADLD